MPLWVAFLLGVLVGILVSLAAYFVNWLGEKRLGAQLFNLSQRLDRARAAREKEEARQVVQEIHAFLKEHGDKLPGDKVYEAMVLIDAVSGELGLDLK